MAGKVWTEENIAFLKQHLIETQGEIDVALILLKTGASLSTLRDWCYKLYPLTGVKPKGIGSKKTREIAQEIYAMTGKKPQKRPEPKTEPRSSLPSVKLSTPKHLTRYSCKGYVDEQTGAVWLTTSAYTPGEAMKNILEGYPSVTKVLEVVPTNERVRGRTGRNPKPEVINRRTW